MKKNRKSLSKLGGADEYKIGGPGDNVSNGDYGVTREEILRSRADETETYLPVRPTKARSGWCL